MKNSQRRRWTVVLIACLAAGCSFRGTVLAADAAPPAAQSADSDAPVEQVDRHREDLLKLCTLEGFSFTPRLRAAYLAYAKVQARSDLKAQGWEIPEAFFAWIDADPQMEAGVYGARSNAADALLVLYSLRLDLGQADFEKYRQLALAAALVHIEEASQADISPREPLSLVINGDPRVAIDTRDTGRALDINDHIINFLNEHTVEEEIVVGHKEVLPELKYDERGVAIPAPKKAKPKKVPILEKRTRTLYAADVLANRALQETFNAYMKSKGHPVDIDCGDQVIHWKSRDMVRGEARTRLQEAKLLFQTAYETKGLLPAERDPFPTPAERCAWLIRNDKYQFSADDQAQRKWPRFPLTAPWPTMTMLVADNQPLREREERWEAFRDEGVFKTYGEYIGSIAQQYDMQSARRLTPHPFTYGSIQMMLKDGGVCGAMANISVRSHNTMGIPACTAGQPGHCAMVAFRYDPKTETYLCKGGQYATGGDDKTTPHAGWFFGDVEKKYRERKGVKSAYYERKPMVYHQSIAWAVNHGMDSFLDSTMAWHMFNLLPESERQTRGLRLLGSGLAINPYNFLLPDAAQAAAQTPQLQIKFWDWFHSQLQEQGGKPGCPTDGLYSRTIKKRLFARIAELTVPEEKEEVRKILEFLENEACDVPAALVAYRLADQGMPALLSRTEKDFRDHLSKVQHEASRESETASAAMAATIKATAGHIGDKEERKQWARKLWEQAQGHEKYFGHKYRVATHPAVPQLAKLSGQKMPPESELIQPLLDQVASELRESVASERNLKDSRVLAARIKALGNSLNKDAERKRQWFETLAELIVGKEVITPAGAGKNAKPVRDPCADAIGQTLQALAE